MKFTPAQGVIKPALLVAVTALFSTSWADLQYKVKPYPASKSFGVNMLITNAKEKETVRIPAWCPGFYFILDYEKRLSDIKVLDPEGNPLKFKWIDSRGFQIQNPEKTPITINYRVLGNDTGLGFFRSHLRANIGFINGPSAFMFADQRQRLVEARKRCATQHGARDPPGASPACYAR